MTTLIGANTTIPTKKEQVFSTASDNQTEVEIKVLQGDRPMAADNKLLGRFNLLGIPPAPKGVPQIEVGFDIDANGIVNVTARDKATGKEQRIQIKSDGGLSKDEITRMKRDAEANSALDKKKAQLSEERNKAESTVWEVEKSLDTYKDEISMDEAKEVRDKIAAVRNAIAANDADQISSSLNALTSSTTQLFTKAYQAKQAKNQGGSSSGSGSGSPQQQSGTEFKDV